MGDLVEFNSGGKKAKGLKHLEYLRQQIGDDKTLQQVSQMSKTLGEAAVNLAVLSYTYERIAEVLGLASAAAARAIVEKQLAGIHHTEGDRMKIRQKASVVLDQYHRQAWAHAMDPDEPDQAGWIKLGLTVLDRKIRLHGADAPIVHYINPEGDELERYVRVLAIANGAEIPTEVDPFEMEQDADGVWSERKDEADDGPAD